MSPQKSFILLGAGASVPAGIPTTNKMTEVFLNGEPSSLSEKDTQILRFIAGGIQQRRGVRGKDPLQSINVEDLFGALRMIAERDSLDVSPFVSQWHPYVDDADRIYEGLDQQHFDFLKEKLEVLTEAIEYSMPGGYSRYTEEPHFFLDSLPGEISQELRELINLSRLSDQQPSKGAFERTGKRMIRALTDLVWLEDPWKTQYLDPLIQRANSKNLTIATLNYDNSVELSSDRLGVNIDTGLEEWSEEGYISKPRAGVELLKLHGSIDWVKSEEHPLDRETDDDLLFPSQEISRSEPEDLSSLDNQSPALIFGARNKLTEEGPFLEILRTFENRLDNCSKLITIGYSFSDNHVNHIIRRWMNQSSDRHMIVVDRPGIDKADHPLWQKHQKLNTTDRVKIRATGAEQGILNLFGSSS